MQTEQILGNIFEHDTKLMPDDEFQSVLKFDVAAASVWSTKSRHDVDDSSIPNIVLEFSGLRTETNSDPASRQISTTPVSGLIPVSPTSAHSAADPALPCPTRQASGPVPQQKLHTCIQNGTANVEMCTNIM